MENSPIRISIAGKEEAGLIADLSRRTFYDTFAPHNTRENMDQFMESQFSREQLMQEVGAPNHIFLLAWLGDDTVAGYVQLCEGGELPRELVGGKAIQIARLYAEQNAIGKGVGKALMEASIGIGRQKNYQWIWLSVWEHNGRAIAFYEKMGFEIFGKQIFLLGQDLQNDWSMKKRL